MKQVILTAPHTLLTQTAQPVGRVDKKVKKHITDLIDTLVAQKDPMGVGLSGNQIGLLKRIFVMRPEENGEVFAFVDPVIESTKEGAKDRKPTLEGCLSIPSVWGHVLRPEKVQISYLSEAGEPQKKWFDGFEAVVIQHEIDHLNGILFTQRVLEQNHQLFREVEGELEPYAL